MENQTIILAGGSGFTGSAMAARWAKENRVIILTRGTPGRAGNSYAKARAVPGVEYLHWDGKTAGSWKDALEGADLLVNLAGKSVNCRYTTANKAEIMNSRVNATKVLGEAIQACSNPPRLWINGGSATIYPHAVETARDESFTKFADDFSVQVCKAWEGAFDAFSLPYTRRAVLRMAIVLGQGGAMVPYARLARLGLGGAQGNGRQYFSWIHIDDLCRIVEWMAENPAASGVYNAASPGAVSNSRFMQAMRKSVGMPFGLPAPEPLIRIGAKLIGTAPELLLKSRWVYPARLLEQGFQFLYTDVDSAIAAVRR